MALVDDSWTREHPHRPAPKFNQDMCAGVVVWHGIAPIALVPKVRRHCTRGTGKFVLNPAVLPLLFLLLLCCRSWFSVWCGRCGVVVVVAPL